MIDVVHRFGYGMLVGMASGAVATACYFALTRGGLKIESLMKKYEKS